MKRRRKLILYPKDNPKSNNVNVKIQYFGSCLGLFGERDKDSSCYRIFIELVKSSKGAEPISSQRLAYKLSLSRGTVVHHLNRLMDFGIVQEFSNRYSLVNPSLEKVIISLNEEFGKLFENLKKVAGELDKRL